MLIAALIASGITLAGLIAGSRALAARQYAHRYRTATPQERQSSCR